MSVAFDRPVFEGNAILLEISEERGRKRYIYNGGHMICSFLTSEKFYKCISNLGKNPSPWSLAIGDENSYFVTPNFKFFKREKFNDYELLKTKEGSVEALDYHVSNCVKELV